MRVPLGRKERLEGESGREGREREKGLVLHEEPVSGRYLLIDHVTEEAPLLLAVVIPSRVQLLGHDAGSDGRGDDLSVRMRQGRARGLAVVLEDQDVSEPGISLQILKPMFVGLYDALDLFLRHLPDVKPMLRRLDDHLMGAHPAHHVVDPDSLPA